VAKRLAPFLVGVLLVSLALSAYGQNDLFLLRAGLGIGYRTSLYVEERAGLEFDDGRFSVVGSLVMRNDGKYQAELATVPGGQFFGNYILMEEGGLGYSQENISLQVGRFRHYDEIDSPYSLFINSLGHSANIVQLRYENDWFVYQTRSIELNSRSAYQSEAWPNGFPDRGASVKTYALKVGQMRVGFQDAAVYTGRSFDLEYLVNPLPQYFIQYVKGTGGRPWTTGANENNIIGLFWDWNRNEDQYFYVQTLLDDFNIHALFPSTPELPYKAGWALGARIDTEVGTFGFHHAGSPRYSFQPITSTSTATQAETAYGYTYYPETRYTVDGQEAPIFIEDTMLGLKLGENTLGFQVDWSHNLGGFDFGALVEYQIAGAASPANPWHDLVFHPLGTRMLDDPVLESTLRAGIEVRKEVGPFLFTLSGDLGYRWNERSLRVPVPEASSSLVDQHVWIWEPVAGANRVLGNAKLTVLYTFDLGAQFSRAPQE